MGEVQLFQANTSVNGNLPKKDTSKLTKGFYLLFSCFQNHQLYNSLALDLLPARLQSIAPVSRRSWVRIPGQNIFLGFMCDCLSYFITARITFTCIYNNL